MHQRVALYISAQSCSTGTFQELRHSLAQAVEDRGDTVVATFTNHGGENRRRVHNSGWKALLAGLDGVDQVAVMSAGDLPGRTTKDILKILDRLRDSGVGVFLVNEAIETGSSPAYSLLDIIRAFRRAKLSQAIKKGQAKALEAGKIIGRPEVPTVVRCRIQASLASGGGIRPTAKRYGVSAGTVINIRRSMMASPERRAA
jgi:hypothetical protein